MSSLFAQSIGMQERKHLSGRLETRRGKRCKVRVLGFIRLEWKMWFEFRSKWYSIIFGSHTNPTRCASHTLAGAHCEQMFAIVWTIHAMVFVNHQLDSLAAQQVLNVWIVCGFFFSLLCVLVFCFYLSFWTLRWALVCVVTCVSAPHFCCESGVRWGMLHLRWKSICVWITGALIYYESVSWINEKCANLCFLSVASTVETPGYSRSL